MKKQKEILSKQKSNGIKRYVTRSKTWRAVKDLEKYIGKKAEVKVLKVSKKTYWYKNGKGGYFRVKLQEDDIFKTYKSGNKWLVWAVIKDGESNSWIQIKDAKIVKWL